LFFIPALRRAQGKPRSARAGIYFDFAVIPAFESISKGNSKMDPGSRGARFTLSPSKGRDDD